MSYTVVVMSPDGRRVRTTQARRPDLDQLQRAVGGFIETVPHFTRLGELRRGVAYCNEYGRLHRLPLNADATTEWRKCLGSGPFRYEPTLLGSVVFYAKTGGRESCTLSD